MAQTQRVAGIILALATATTMLFSTATAQAGCTTALVGLMPCLSYITGNTSTPASSCCTQLASIVQSQPQCLCLLVNGSIGPSLGITFNNTQALALPAACKVQTPPVSQCNAAAGGPAPSPAETPKAGLGPSPATSSTPSSPTSTPTTPSTPNNPAPETPSSSSTPSQPNVPTGSSGSKTTPSTVTDTSDGNSIRSSATASLLLMGAFVSAIARF